MTIAANFAASIVTAILLLLFLASNSCQTQATRVTGFTRVKRFTLLGTRWPTNNLTYKISVYPSRFEDSNHKVDKIFRLSFDKWARVSRLAFTQVFDRQLDANIDIRFVRDKGFKDPTKDGINVPVVLSFDPNPNEILNRPLYFNDYADWCLRNVPVANKSFLLGTAIHEIGHVLGLGHSTHKEARMSPWIVWRWDTFKTEDRNLHEDDIAGIQALYGDAKLKQFYRLDNRRFNESDLMLYEKNADTMEDCASYALDTKYNLAIFNGLMRKCAVTRNYNDNSEVLYKSTGIGMVVQGPRGHEIDRSKTALKVEVWIKSGKCDTIGIVRGANNSSLFHYTCKQYPIDSCCSILFKLDEIGYRDHLLKSLVDAPLND